jgi:hypothetical protein
MLCATMLALLLVAGTACAQSPEMRAPAADDSSVALPDAPQPASEQQAVRATGAIASGHEPGARIKGVVSDIQGGLVPGAHIVIASTEASATHETTADSAGFFSVGDLPAGTYSVTISSPGLKTYVIHDLHLRPGETYSVPEVSLPIARTSADVTVTLTTEQLAEEELHNELKQRVLGVLPNFYTSYQWNAAPLTAKQKLRLTMRATTDPVFLGTTAITAAIEQAQNTYPEYGGGPAGYWKRYGAAYGDAVIGRLMGSVVFATVFRQDPRYFVMTNGSWERRSWHAISSTVIQRGDNRRWQPAYAHIFGSASAALIASTYHPGSNPGKLVLDDTVLDLGSKAANNLIREFVLRHLAKNIPSYAKGKPPEE